MYQDLFKYLTYYRLHICNNSVSRCYYYHPILQMRRRLSETLTKFKNRKGGKRFTMWRMLKLWVRESLTKKMTFV